MNFSVFDSNVQLETCRLPQAQETVVEGALKVTRWDYSQFIVHIMPWGEHVIEISRLTSYYQVEKTSVYCALKQREWVPVNEVIAELDVGKLQYPSTELLNKVPSYSTVFVKRSGSDYQVTVEKLHYIWAAKYQCESTRCDEIWRYNTASAQGDPDRRLRVIYRDSAAAWWLEKFREILGKDKHEVTRINVDEKRGKSNEI